MNDEEVHPLSNDEIADKLAEYDINVNFFRYRDIKHLDDLEENTPMIILYELTYPIGHWCCLFRNEDGINYFDPTGVVPDGLLSTSFDNIQGRVKTGADYTYLNQLLLDTINQTGEQLIYNEVELQPPSTSTCGYWVAVRLLFSEFSNDDFNDIFKSIPTRIRQEKIVKLYNKF